MCVMYTSLPFNNYLSYQTYYYCYSIRLVGLGQSPFQLGIWIHEWCPTQRGHNVPVYVEENVFWRVSTLAPKSTCL